MIFIACYSPLVALKKYDSYNDKNIIKILGSLTNYQNDYYDYSPLENEGVEKILLPCGKCVGCRLEYSRQWAVRCMLEAKQYEHNYFLTLTYDDENLDKSCYKVNYNADTSTGELLDASEVYSLNKNDLTKFMKDLREHWRTKYNETDIRFFACGEYGSKYGRPHFHIILFNLNIRDLKYLKSNNGIQYFISDEISSIWKKGIICIGEVTFDSCAYVARYCLKKVDDNISKSYEEYNIEQPFTRMSRRPGIGRDYFDKNKEHIYQYDKLVLPGGYGKVLEIKPPRYYDLLYDVECPDDLKEIKERRKSKSENLERFRIATTSVSDKFDYLKLQEGNKKAQLKRLPRPLE